MVYRRRRSLLCRLVDGTGQITLRFFYFSKAQQDGLARGRARASASARRGPAPAGSKWCIPSTALLAAGERPALDESLTPVYPATEGLQQFRLRNLVGQALDRFLPMLPGLAAG